MKLWLDDIRDPRVFGYADWVWVKTAQEAIKCFRTGEVIEASLDYNLADFDQSGYDVIVWLEQHPEFWPPLGVKTHSSNPDCNARMQKVIDRHYKKA